jgi:adenylate cyclase
MGESNFFAYWPGDETPLEKYNNAAYIKELLYQGDNPEEGVTFDTYLDFRRDYLEAAGAFLNGSYEETILGDLWDEEELKDFVSRLFAVSREQYERLLFLREQAAERTRGAFCVIGVAATSMTDEGLITFEDRYPNVGTYSVISNMILSGEFLDDAPAWLSLALALVLALALAFLIKRLPTGRSVLAGLAAMVFTAAAPLVFFIFTRRYIPAVVPFATVGLTFLSLTGINFFITIREKSFLRSAFSRYLAPEVINQIIDDPSKLNLGGEKREMTAIFTDIQSFSSISEALQNEYAGDGPKVLVNLLNLYLTEMSNIVLANGGTIDKYEVDAIIAFFGAPIWTEKHAALACRSAIQMKKREKELVKDIMSPDGDFCVALGKLIETGVIRKDRPLYTRLGVNSGDMVVGNMGTPNKMDYTVMGNAVNLASRLERVNKYYQTGGILISEYTKEKISSAFLYRTLDRVRVVGIKTPLRLYELLGFAGEAGSEQLESAAAWEKALDSFEKRDFKTAVMLFSSLTERCGDDRTAEFYRSRCVQFLEVPPPPDWDGVNNISEK